ncbi:tail fiber protein [Aestuariibacter sp. AA17]|uniref:Tail fiber protein n=1 Tax=Fluctibacter corallii TaxID=2984329 RepID=A0ABT3A8X3_9ALTE|nr:tail fiber protein [Aestuariibacter sp. AA17]MCV2885134.1 tail fiber protein [Aestuariibacter sp. AA17]
MKLCKYVTLTLMSSLLGLSLFTAKVNACSSDVFIGTVCMFGGNFTIRGYAPANGQLLSISSNTALFSLYGTTYGGDGRTTFALPDLRGRSPIGIGQGIGLPTVSLGQQGGAVETTLSVSQMPAHSHGASTTVQSTSDGSSSSAILRALAGSANVGVPTGAVLANNPTREDIYNTGLPTVDMSANAIVLDVQVTTSSSATTTIANAGGSQPVQIRNPYLGINFLIALDGIYPSRN